MNLVPFRRRGGLNRVHDALDDVFNRFFEDWEGLPGRGVWVPAVDVAEREDAIVVKVELPGLQVEDIDVSVHGDTLILSGEKKEVQEDQKENYYHVERRYGRFQRTVALPTSVEAGKIEAKHRDGVLTVTLPKSEQAKPKRITVKTE